MPRRDPFDYFDCPLFELTITRWDGHGTKPVVIYGRHVMAQPWAYAARLFASGLIRNATGRLAPPRRVKDAADAA